MKTTITISVDLKNSAISKIYKAGKLGGILDRFFKNSDDTRVKPSPSPVKNKEYIQLIVDVETKKQLNNLAKLNVKTNDIILTAIRYELNHDNN